ncbi:dr1-associated corepressor [Diabrotica virgifera virgifera]|uniref:Dr1-associated corepressor n=1 Tax=Diabrotica virgifera virgifera TaxID=50390 RepID=A0A6P7G9N2_DIAVI|nr:dr1-associated corepressor [Diabrotica virgifera virgifera]XP_028143563.1 dr1-associated corepressor [Diabrotica virgifera virgifera]
MPSKKKKYNARFPAGRIKKIMQTDEEVGKVAQAVPVIISRTLELFVESLLTKSMQITQARNAKTLTPSHMKQCILSESRFDFLKDLVKNIPDASIQEDNENNALFEEGSLRGEEVVDEPSPSLPSSASSRARSSRGSTHERNVPQTDVYVPTHSHTALNEQSTSTSRTPVIQYGPKVVNAENSKINFSVTNLLKPDEPKLHVTIASEELAGVPQLLPTSRSSSSLPPRVNPNDIVPPLVPISRYSQNSSDNNLYIDEEYDN